MSSVTPPEGHALAVGRMRLAGLVLAAVLVLGLATWWLLRSRTSTFGFKGRDWIVVCEFENRTGEEIFDKSLDAALLTSISQSSYINIIPRSRVDQDLYWLKKPLDSVVDEPTGREIAKREKLKLLLAPRIVTAEGGYEISLALKNPSGTEMKSVQMRIARKEEVLTALDQLVRELRRSLGETETEIARESRPLANALTGSLEALRQYSIGMEKNRQGIIRQARVSFDNALAIDPAFAAAKAELGKAHWEADKAREQTGIIRFEGIDRELGKKLLSEAIVQTDRLTERERYRLEAFYARTIENDVAKAARQLALLVSSYPDDSIAHHNLGVYYSQLGRFDDAAVEFREVLRLDPMQMLAYDSLAGLYLNELGRVTEAISLCQAQIARNERYAPAYDNLGWAWLGKGDLLKARDAFQKAIRLNPRMSEAQLRLAHTYRLLKKYRDALEPLQQISEAESPDVLYQRGVLLTLLNEKKLAEKHFELYRDYIERDLTANPRDADAQMQLAVVLARLGRNDQAEAVREKALAMGGTDGFGAALVSSVMGKTDDAMDRLEAAAQKGFRDFIWMKIHPDLQALYGQPRFEALLRRYLK